MRFPRLYFAPALLCALLACGCNHAPISGAGVAIGPAAATPVGVSALAPLLPNPALTPGAIFPVGVQQIAVLGYARSVRDVPIEEKKAAYAEYHIPYRRGQYEVDHLISLELGGSNSIKNLWPQAYFTEPWNAHVKDDLENKLHDLVCSGQVPLPVAQQAIATNWIAAYKKYFNTEAPIPGGYDEFNGQKYAQSGSQRQSYASYTSSGTPSYMSQPRLPATPGGGAGLVWVNTRSGRYFVQGMHYYGRTRVGKYMPLSEAQQEGDIPAHGY